MAYKSKVFDINKNFPYNVGVRKSATYFYSAPTFFVETGDDISRYYKAIRGKNEARKDNLRFNSFSVNFLLSLSIDNSSKFRLLYIHWPKMKANFYSSCSSKRNLNRAATSRDFMLSSVSLSICPFSMEAIRIRLL